MIPEGSKKSQSMIPEGSKKSQSMIPEGSKKSQSMIPEDAQKSQSMITHINVNIDDILCEEDESETQSKFSLGTDEEEKDTSYIKNSFVVEDSEDIYYEKVANS
jgi:hypothetical protein